MQDEDWIKIVGVGILALLQEYRGPPRHVIEMYKDKIKEVLETNLMEEYDDE
jgi:hypothetical protein